MATADIVTSAYRAVVRINPPTGYATGVAAQIDSGVLTLGQWEGELVANPSVQSTTLPALVLYDAFYGSTENSGGLDYVTGLANQILSSDSPTDQYKAEHVYSTMGSWFALGSNNFSTLYGTGVDRTTFIQSVYQNVFGTLPPAAALSYLLGSLNTYVTSIQAAGIANAELLGRGAVYGDLLYIGQSTQTGNYYSGANKFMQTLVTDAASGTTPTVYGEPLSSLAPPAPVTAYLTTGADNVTATNVVGSLTPFFNNGVGPTLNSTDVINGTPGSSNNTLTLADDYAAGADIIPIGVTLNNVQNVILNTSGNAGIGAGTPFDVSPYSGVTNVVVNSAGGGVDAINAASGQSITDKQSSSGANAGASITGGSAVTVTSSGGSVSSGIDGPATYAYGGVTIGTGVKSADPTGAVNVTENGLGQVQTFGGTNQTVTVTSSSNQAAVRIGSDFDGQPLRQVVSGPPSVDAPSGNVNVTDAGTGNVEVAGGQAVVVNTTSGAVQVGSATPSIIPNPTGAVTVNAAVPVTYNELPPPAGNNTQGGPINVYGGADVTVTTNTGGAVQVGNGTANAVTTPTGNVSITDTATDAEVFGSFRNADFLGQSDTVYGGQNVTVTAAGAAVTVGNGVPGTTPSGAVSVTETAASGTTVSVDGGNGVNVSAQGQTVNVGTQAGTSGAQVVTQSALLTGTGLGLGGGAVTVDGGTSVNVNTTGGNVTVGGSTPTGTLEVPSGAVTIADTFGAGNANADAIAEQGGTTVGITTTATSGSDGNGQIDVGAAPALNSAGSGLNNGAPDPTGNVTIVNADTNGGKTTYGTAVPNVYTNGATSVSVTGGGGGGTIEDVQSKTATGGPGAGKAIGTATLANVSLDGVAGTTTVQTDALQGLTLLDNTGASGATVIDNTAGHALAVTVGNEANATIGDAKAGSVTVTDTGIGSTVAGVTGPNGVTLATTAATSATFNNSAGLNANLTSDAALKNITAAGAGALNLGDVSGLGNLASIAANTSSGAVSVTLDPNNTSFSGGSGADTVTLTQNALGKGVTLQGGTGSNDTIVANYAADVAGANTDIALGNNANIKGFENLGLGANADSTLGAYDASGFSGLVVGATTANSVTFSNVAASASLTVTANEAGKTITYTLQNSSGTNDSLPLTVGKDGTKTTGTGNLNVSVATTGVENLQVNSLGYAGTSSAPNANTVTISDNAANTVTVTGDQNLNLTLAGANSVGSINASQSSGTVDVTDVALKAAGGAILGGSGLLKASGVVGATGAVDSITTGSGGGQITLGSGGSWTGTAYGSGSETVNLTASVGVSDTIVVGVGNQATFNGASGGITGFQASAGNAADKLSFAATENVVANLGTPQAVTTAIAGNSTGTTGADILDMEAILGLSSGTLDNLTFALSNGVITFGATGAGHSVSDFTAAQLVSAAEIIVNEEGANSVAAFNTGGNTFVVTSDNAHTLLTSAQTDVANANLAATANLDSSVELLGVPSVSGFGTTAAANTIEANVLNPSAGNNGSATAANTYNDAGFAHDSFSAAGAGNFFSDAAATGSTTYKNLAASAVLDVSNSNINGFAAHVGTISTTQVGGAGSNSLTVNLGANGELVIVDALNVGGDYGVTVNTGENPSQITSLVDAGNTLTTLTLDNTSAFYLGGVSDSALATVDASASTGYVSIGDTFNGTQAPLAQNGLAIKLGSGGGAVFASGAGDTISGPAGGATAAITANGAGDTITLGNNANTIISSGAGDTITVGTGGNTVTATGAGDTITIGSSTGLNTAASSLTVGSNATVDNAQASHGAGVKVTVTGDTTGATSSGNFAFTTISNADLGLDTINFAYSNPNAVTTENWAGGSAASSLVNVSAATTLAQALDIAANYGTAANAGIGPHSGMFDWLQFGGNTYLLESVNTTGAQASHAVMGASDVLVKLSGLQNLAGASNFVGHSLTL